MIELRPPALVLDDFLSAEAADRILAAMLAEEARFARSKVQRRDRPHHDSTVRSSLGLRRGHGVQLDGLIAAIHAQFGTICETLGIAPFAIYDTERTIVAHRDGDFFRRHGDTEIRPPGERADEDVRVVSCVYYLHRRPRGFTGGELAIHAYRGEAPPRLIEPGHNRLVAFPSIAQHEVRPIRTTGDFADSRFSVNVWLRRAIALSDRVRLP